MINKKTLTGLSTFRVVNDSSDSQNTVETKSMFWLKIITMTLILILMKTAHYPFQYWHYLHCVKSVQIRSFSWSVFSCIRPEYRKIQTRKNSVFGHFSRSVTPTRWLKGIIKIQKNWNYSLLWKLTKKVRYLV